MKKTGKFLALASLASAAAYVAYRYKNLEPRDTYNKVEKKLITLNNDVEDKKEEVLSEESKEMLNEKEINYPYKSKKVYMYLKNGFVNAIEGQRDDFTKEYPTGTFVEISHQIDFEDLRELIYFNALTKDINYKVELQEELKTISLGKTIEILDDNTLVREILEVADFVTSNGGYYQGYSISIV